MQVHTHFILQYVICYYMPVCKFDILKVLAAANVSPTLLIVTYFPTRNHHHTASGFNWWLKLGK